jgi:hypothetical protein
LLRLNERDVLNTLLTPPRLDLFTGRQLKPKCLIRDRLVERGRERRDPESCGTAAYPGEGYPF